MDKVRKEMREKLLNWYDRHQRTLSWRAVKGEAPNPYLVWLSEIMLQQTTVATVIPYFEKFIQRWPTITALAQANIDEVLHAWQGLGYYTRARNLHRCSKAIVEEYKGVFPSHPEELKKLPGLGPYTAKAIAAIAFNQPYVPIDGNIKRVLSRFYATTEDISSFAEALASPERPGDFAQALMDLGATLCTPRKPNCLVCPWLNLCQGTKTGHPEAFPSKQNKPLKPVRYATAFILQKPDGSIALQKRPAKGLLGGMMEVPTTPWIEEKPLQLKPPVNLDYLELPGEVRHTFTHFHFVVRVCFARVSESIRDYMWVHPKNLRDMALPTLMKKIIAHGLKNDSEFKRIS